MTFLFRHPFTLIFFFALLLRLGYLFDIYDTPIWQLHMWTQTDMDTFLKGAAQIQEQGLLVPHPYHPYHAVHAQTGSPQQWDRWLGGEHAFYRVPGYYYFLALVLGLSEGSLLAVKVVHALLGAAHSMLLGLIGARMMDRRAGIFTGLLAAAYGPFIAVEGMILRDGLGLLLAATGLYLVLRSLWSTFGTVPGGNRLVWLGAGLILGVGALVKETNTILFGSIWLWSLFRSLRARELFSRQIPWLLLFGFLVALVPFVLRNLIVAAPPLTPSSLFTWNFAIANAVDHPTGGVTLEFPPTVAAVMAGSEARLSEAIRLTWQNYEGRHTEFFVNWWSRFSALWRNIEFPDNYSYDHLVIHSNLLPFLPRFVCIGLPAFAAVSLLAWRRFRPTPPESGLRFAPGTLSLLLICLALTATALSVNIVVGRYRLLITPFLMLLAGGMLAQAMVWLLLRDVQKLVALSVALVFLSVLWWRWPAPPRLQVTAIRLTDFEIATQILMRQGNPAGARAELKKGLAYCHQPSVDAVGLRLGCTQYLVQISQNLFGEAPEAGERVSP